MKMKLLFMSSILANTLAYSQVVFIQSTLQSNSATRDAKIYDLDGDGDKDIVMTDRNSPSNLIWFENQGSGTFSAAIELYNYGANWQAGLEEFDLLDLDNDGDVDIASVTIFGGEVVRFLNDGSQNFSMSTIDHAGSFDAWIHGIDVSNDNYPEIISESILYTNSGGVIDSNGIPLNTSGYSIVSHDFTGDGYQDIAMFTYFNEIVLLPNNGAGGFNAAQTIDSNLDFGYYWMSVSDLNDDGYMDILYPSSDYFPNSSNIMKWYESDGAGGFTNNDLFTVDTNYVVTHLIAQDMDNDGDNDIVASLYQDQSYAGVIKCYWNDGTDGFDSSDYQIVTTDIEYTVSLSADDIDSDGDIDILTGTFGGAGGVAWFQNQTVPNTTSKDFKETLHSQISISPNPSNGLVHISSHKTITTTRVIDLTGRTIQTHSLFSNNTTIDLSSLMQGVYFIETVTINEQMEVQKIVIN